MACDPAYVGCAPEHVVILQVEDVFAGEIGLHCVPAGGMEQTLGLAGGSGRVKQIERVLRIHPFRGTLRRGFFHRVVPPDVAAGLHGNGRTGAPEHDDVLYCRALYERLVDDVLQVDLGASAEAGVLRDDGDAA